MTTKEYNDGKPLVDVKVDVDSIYFCESDLTYLVKALGKKVTFEFRSLMRYTDSNSTSKLTIDTSGLKEREILGYGTKVSRT